MLHASWKNTFKCPISDGGNSPVDAGANGCVLVDEYVRETGEKGREVRVGELGVGREQLVQAGQGVLLHGRVVVVAPTKQLL